VLGLYRTALDQDATGSALVVSARAAVVAAGTYRLVGTLTAADGTVVELASSDIDLPAGVTDVSLSYHANGLAAGEYMVSDLTLAAADDPSDEATGPSASHVLTAVEEPQDPARPVLRSRASVTLANQFRTVGTDGDVVTDGDFACNSSVHVQGDVVAAGDVSMTNECRIDGDVRAGGSVSLNSTAKIGGDVTAVGDVSVQESVTVGGSILAGGTVTSIDARAVTILQDQGAIGGTVTAGAPVDAPTLPAHLTAEDLGSPWSDFTEVTWQQWLNQTAAANDAPSWSQGLTSTPGCVMAPWGASVNGEHVAVSTPTVVDARTATSGCSGATLQGMTLDLGADLVLLADQLTFVNGLTVTSVDGSDHVLQIVVPSDDGTAIALAAPNGITASPQVQVQVVTGGGVQINGATSVPALLDVGFLRASGSVDLVRPGTA
jgi:cytoskeletal protein CcmA (bactofilin family)